MGGFKRCPKCGDREFRIQAMQAVEVRILIDRKDPEEFEVLDTEQNGDTEWDDHDRVTCVGCQTDFTVIDITIGDDENPPEYDDPAEEDDEEEVSHV